MSRSPIDRIARGLYAKLERMTDAQLREIVNAPPLLTQTNCWWLTYELARPLANVAVHILKQRQERVTAEVSPNRDTEAGNG